MDRQTLQFFMPTDCHNMGKKKIIKSIEASRFLLYSINLKEPKKNKKKNRQQNLFLQNFTNILSKLNEFTKRKEQSANSVDPNEMVHYKQLHIDLYCLQIQPFSIFDALSINSTTYKQCSR